MRLLNKLLILLAFLGFAVPTYAAVDSYKIGSCSVFGEEEKKDGEAEGDEEPDCE